MRNSIKSIKESLLQIFNSIQSKLIVMYFFIIVIPMVFVSVFSYKTYFNFIEKKVTDSMLENLTQITNNLDNYIGEIEKLSLITYSNEDIQRVLKTPYSKDNKIDADELFNEKRLILSGSKTIYNYFIDLMSSRDDILGVYILCENGQVYKTSRGEYINDINEFKESGWYKAVINNSAENTIFTENILERYVDYDSSVVSFCKVIKDPKTFKNLGIIVFSLDTEKIKNMAVKSDIKSDTRTLITNADGRIIYYTNERLINKIVTNNFYMDILYRDNGRVVTNLNNEKYMVFFNTSRYTGWKVVEIINNSTFYKQIYNLKIIGISMVFFVILTVAILIYVSSAITRPLKTLTNAMSSVNEDSMDIKVDISSNDEVGVLSRNFNAMIDRIKSLIDNVYTAQIKQKEAELSALQSQINPHFLYNTLEMIGNIAVIEDVELIAKITNCMGKMFRYTISSKREVVTIRDEINHTKNYMVIQQLRFSNRFDIIFDIEDGLENYIIPKLLLQPLVENAVHHGLERKIGNGIILVSIKKVNGNEMEICISDNGVGIESETLAVINKSLKDNYNYLAAEDNKGKGFALVNTNMRLALLFGEKYGIEVESKENYGTKVIIKVPALETLPEDHRKEV